MQGSRVFQLPSQVFKIPRKHMSKIQLRVPFGARRRSSSSQVTSLKGRQALHELAVLTKFRSDCMWAAQLSKDDRAHLPERKLLLCYACSTAAVYGILGEEQDHTISAFYWADSSTKSVGHRSIQVPQHFLDSAGSCIAQQVLCGFLSTHVDCCAGNEQAKGHR